MIILVEEDDSNRMVISACLDHMRQKFKAAKNFKEAFILLDKYTPSFLLTDIFFTLNEGKQLIEYCQKKHPNCKIVLITTQNKNEAEIVFKNLKMDKFLTKPFDLEDLEKVLK